MDLVNGFCTPAILSEIHYLSLQNKLIGRKTVEGGKTIYSLKGRVFVDLCLLGGKFNF